MAMGSRTRLVGPLLILGLLLSVGITPTAAVATPSVVRPDAGPAPAPDALIGLWHLDGNALDSSGHGHNGTIMGATATTGVSGQAYAFDGNAGISVGNLDFSGGSYTVNMWFRTTIPANTGDWRVMIGKTNIASGDQTFEIVLGDGRPPTVGGGNAPIYIVWQGAQGAVNIPATTVTPNTRDGNWHMATTTYSPGSQQLYVDGCLAGTSSYGGPLPIVSNDVVIGGVDGFGPYHHPWKGDLDEVSIYSRSLGQTDVANLWQLYRSAPSCGTGNSIVPTCKLSRIIDGSPKQIQVSVSDTGSGLASITVITAVNLRKPVDIPSFAVGTTDTVVVTATKDDQNRGSQLGLTVTDVAGNTVTCDPVEVTLGHRPGQPAAVLNNLSAVEHLLTVVNGRPGVGTLRVLVNGRILPPLHLSDGQSITVDLAPALRPGTRNSVVLVATGAIGGTATVLAHN